jgi:DNA-binding PadR family transcriptional regulator
VKKALDPLTFLPLTAPEFHVMLALGRDALHGYGMMRALEEKTGGADVLLPGTLYTTLARMVERGLLEELDRPPDPGADARRRYYRATRLGLAVGRAEAARLARLLGAAQAAELTPEPR